MKLKNSGYKVKQRMEIMLSGLRGYSRMCEVEDSGGRRINRTREERATKRRIQKVIGKTNWFKEGSKYTVQGEGESKKSVRGGPPIPREIRECNRQSSKRTRPKETEAVLFVPCTPGGILQRRIQEVEDKFTAGTKLKRIRVVERGGTKLKDLLCAGDPWSNLRCERKDCLPCGCREDDRTGINCQKRECDLHNFVLGMYQGW